MMTTATDDQIIALDEQWWRDNQCLHCDQMRPACCDGDQMARCMAIAFEHNPDLRREVEEARE